MRINYKLSQLQKGISLIELVIFIVIMSVALTGITLIYINTTRYSADPMVRIRSIELAQSTLEEILLKKYDENSPEGGGCVPYNVAAGNTLCLPANPLYPAALTDEGETRATFNDVDDYHNKLYCGLGVVPADTACTSLTCESMENAPGNDISAEYAGFSVCIQVAFAGAEMNTVTVNSGTAVINVAPNDAKRIDVTVTDPLNSRIGLSAYRLNF